MHSIIIPVYNEAASLPALLAEIVECGLLSSGELIIVDDSEDQATYDACHLFLRYPQIRFLSRAKRLGLASAVMAGFELASGDLLICMDGDGSHSPSVVQELIKTSSSSEAEVIVGSRYVAGGQLSSSWPLLRRFFSRFFCLLVWPLTKVSDPMSGCFAVRKSFYHQHKAKFCAVGYKILLEILVKSRCQTTLELPLSFRSRKEGSSKVNIKIMLESIYHICNLYKFGVLSKKD